MQTLGLAAEQKPSDGMFKRLFWPTIENQYDLDLVSQQGFWVCFVVAALSTIVLTVSGQVVLGLALGLTYYLAANGVRERSIAAAVLIFLCYLLDRVSSVLYGTVGGFGAGSPLIGIVSLMLLLANVRATLLARRWKHEGTTPDQTETLERTSGSPTEKLANVLPPRVWPIGRFFFYPLAALVLALTVLGMVMMPTFHRRQAEMKRQQEDQQMITVEPSK